MTLQKSTSANGSESSEDELFIKEPLTQKDPDDPSTPSDDQQERPKVKSVSKNSSKEKPVSVNSIFSIEELTSDDEIFTLQCPEQFNKQDMCNKSLDFSQFKATITSKNETYQLEFINSEKKSITLAVPKKTNGNSLLNMPLKGHIIIKKIVDLPTTESDVTDTDPHDKHVVVFPTNIKVRHPLLGTDWKAHINLVNEAISKKKLAKKKGKKDKSLELKKDNKKLKRENSELETAIHKKKKKHDL